MTRILLLMLFFVCASCAGEIAPHPVKDDTPPQLEFFFPVNGGVAQPLNVRIELTFDDKMLPASCSSNNFFLIKDGTSSKVSVREYLLPEKGQGKKIYMYLASNLEPNTVYRVFVMNGVCNEGKQPYAGTNWSFTTGTNTTNYQPVVTISSPTNNQFFKTAFKATGSCQDTQWLYFSVNSAEEAEWHSVPMVDGKWSVVTNLFGSPYFSVSEGQNRFYIHARKNYNGEIVTTTRSVEFMVDVTPPVIALTSHSNGDVLKGVVTFGGTVADANLDYVEIAVGASSGFLISWRKVVVLGSTNWSYTFDTSSFSDVLPPDAVGLWYRAVDKAGATVEGCVAVNIDN